jgi:very-short-patch-repair endonuclease
VLSLLNYQTMQRISPQTKNFSRQLRSKMTDAESHLWRRLRGRQIGGLKFRRQHPVGKFILDFACVELKLAIEVDGGQHGELLTSDRTRTTWLEQQGWEILRFWNNEILQNTEDVLEQIHHTITVSSSINTPSS